MTHAVSIEGTVTLGDGTESQFLIATDYNGTHYTQWGADRARLGQLTDLLDEIASLLADGDWREV